MICSQNLQAIIIALPEAPARHIYNMVITWIMQECQQTPTGLYVQ